MTKINYERLVKGLHDTSSLTARNDLDIYDQRKQLVMSWFSLLCSELGQVGGSGQVSPKWEKLQSYLGEKRGSIDPRITTNYDLAMSVIARSMDAVLNPEDRRQLSRDEQITVDFSRLMD